ncbi:hypothetical protein J7E24_00930 [Hymenobacter sp. ISL-91]|uniref:DUF922 domain-containing protein n=1 Tax=Hymenobacter sp. ISL-91 TaxID=2819151 RepID=UPI001BE5CA3B|nr:hypothetical protein [Hymenobacter sp. ISL-91]MBT2556339.1 hypothetical protein [Hymenobacter sp. ISL-91]
MKRLLFYPLLALAATACAPRAVIKPATLNLAGPAVLATPTAATAEFLVITEDQVFEGPAEELGDIVIRDSGFTLSCDYETVVALASDKARALGANALRIYEHKVPSMRSTCHQIRARALRLTDLAAHEREIVWQPNRRLRVADFKGPVANRPFQAATSSNIRYRYAGLGLGKVRLTVETYFSCPDSYFKPSATDSLVLAHEQVHFDITELYARRFVRQLGQQATNTRELQQKHEILFRQLQSESQLLQDAYDSETYEDPALVAAWQQRIARELAELQAYADKTLTFKVAL